MSWTLRDRQKSGQAPKEPPPKVEIDDSLPLPSMGYFSLTDEDDATPPPGMGALSMELKTQGAWSERALDDYSLLVRRGVDAVRDDADGAHHGSAHELPRPRLVQGDGVSRQEAPATFWERMRRVLVGKPAPTQEAAAPAPETPGPQWRSAHEVPPGYRPGGDRGE